MDIWLYSIQFAIMPIWVYYKKIVFLSYKHLNIFNLLENQNGVRYEVLFPEKILKIMFS